MKVSTRVLGILSTLVAAHPIVHGSYISTEPSTLTKRATICNGHPELCERSYGEMTVVGTHNSYAVGVNNLGANQDHDITTQLRDGVRMLQVQAHLEEGEIRLCHTSCRIYDGGSLAAYLATVKTWLDANPDEVLSILIVNADDVPATDYATIYASVGLDAVSYSPPTPSVPFNEWPTLGEMIDSGRRLVTYLSTTANPEAVPYLIDEFTNIWETEFNVIDPNFNCDLNRGNGDSATQMYLINHFLNKEFLGQRVPDLDRMEQTNAAEGFGSLGLHVETCTNQHTRAPNFLLVDFYEYGGGSVFEVAARVNGVPYNPTTPVATPVSTVAGTQTDDPKSAAMSGRMPHIQGIHIVAGVVTLLGSLFIGPLLVL